MPLFRPKEADFIPEPAISGVGESSSLENALIDSMQDTRPAASYYAFVEASGVDPYGSDPTQFLDYVEHLMDLQPEDESFPLNLARTLDDLLFGLIDSPRELDWPLKRRAIELRVKLRKLS